MSEDVAVHKTTSSFQRYAVRRPPFACDNGRFRMTLETLLTLARRYRRARGLQSNQAAPGRVCNSFCAADDIHLGEDGFTMRLDGAFTDK